MNEPADLAPTDVWICSAKDKEAVVIACFGTVTGFELRSYAARRLGVDPFAIMVKATSLRWTTELQWTGSDYSAGGSPNRLRLQQREAGEQDWKDV